MFESIITEIKCLLIGRHSAFIKKNVGTDQDLGIEERGQ